MENPILNNFYAFESPASTDSGIVSDCILNSSAINLRNNVDKSSLPCGWEIHYDDNNLPYYWHLSSGTVQREIPKSECFSKGGVSSVNINAISDLCVDLSLEKNEPNSMSDDKNEMSKTAPKPQSGCRLKYSRSFSNHIDQTRKNPFSSKIIPPNKNRNSNNDAFGNNKEVINPYNGIFDSIPPFPATNHINSALNTENSKRNNSNLVNTTVITFYVRSLGWTQIAEHDLTPERSSKAINKCILDLSHFGRSGQHECALGAWGEGQILTLEIDGHCLCFRNSYGTVITTQPIHAIKVWGVGKENGKDFAYVIRDTIPSSTQNVNRSTTKFGKQSKKFGNIKQSHTVACLEKFNNKTANFEPMTECNQEMRDKLSDYNNISPDLDPTYFSTNFSSNKKEDIDTKMAQSCTIDNFANINNNDNIYNHSSGNFKQSSKTTLLRDQSIIFNENEFGTKNKPRYICYVFRCEVNNTSQSCSPHSIANALKMACKRLMIERSNKTLSMTNSHNINPNNLKLNSTTAKSHEKNGCNNILEGKDMNVTNVDMKNSVSTMALTGKQRPQNLTLTPPLITALSPIDIGFLESMKCFPTPIEEPYKMLRALYLGEIKVSKPSGMDILNEAIDRVYEQMPICTWMPVIVKISPSCISIYKIVTPKENIDSESNETDNKHSINIENKDNMREDDEQFIDLNTEPVNEHSNIDFNELKPVAINNINCNENDENTVHNEDEPYLELLHTFRVRYLSFLGVWAHDIRGCGFIVRDVRTQLNSHNNFNNDVKHSVSKDANIHMVNGEVMDNNSLLTADPEIFVCQVLFCEPSAALLCKTLEAACRLRYQKCLDSSRNRILHDSNNNINDNKNLITGQNVINSFIRKTSFQPLSMSKSFSLSGWRENGNNSAFSPLSLTNSITLLNNSSENVKSLISNGLKRIWSRNTFV